MFPSMGMFNYLLIVSNVILNSLIITMEQNYWTDITNTLLYYSLEIVIAFVFLNLTLRDTLQVQKAAISIEEQVKWNIEKLVGISDM